MGEKVGELWREGFVEKMTFERLEWKREEVMDGENRDEGDDEEMYVCDVMKVIGTDDQQAGNLAFQRQDYA